MSSSGSSSGSEKQIQSAIFKEVGSHQHVRLFRNNVGTAWAGNVQRISRPCRVSLSPGDIVIRNPRPLHAGLHKGSGDLIGWRRRIVTPADIGNPVAQFLSLEVKNRRGRASADQLNWADAVRAFGGLAAIVRSVDEAMEVINTDLLPF